MLDNLQIDTATVQAPTPTKGTSGAEVVTFTTVVADMPCRVLDASAQWRILYAQRNIDVTHQVFTNQNPTIKTGYQLVWQGRTLRVIAAYVKDGTGRVMQIDCSELVGG